MKILHLTLKKKWFDLIASGEKKIEYREDKPYWRSRLIKEPYGKAMFDEIHFRNGYSKNAPFMRVKYDGMFPYIVGEIPTGLCPKNGEELDRDKQYFAITLGEVLEVLK